MKLSLRWLRDFIDIEHTPQEIAELLTQTGLEVESFEEVETVKGGLKGLVVGLVKECEKHPGADKLSLTKVDVGQNELLSIVCGAPNVAKGQKVIVATVGTTVYPLSSEPFEIKKAKIRGELSEGMICAEDEIGLGESHDGILVLESSAQIGQSAAEYFGISSDWVFEIGLTPNRSDAASHFGAARDLFAVTGTPLKKSDFQLPNRSKKPNINVEIVDNKACPRYAGQFLSNITIQPSEKEVEQRLATIGLRPKNHVVDFTNYVLHGWGQPMHAFDADKIEGKKIIVRFAKEGEQLILLDGQEIKLTTDDLVIADSKKPLALAGIMGGLESAVSQTTTNIFLESAYFNPDVVRASSQRHGLKTDSSFRFERGTDPRICSFALQLLTSFLIDKGANLEEEALDIYPNPIEDKTFIVNIDYINNLIGKELEKKQILTILNRLDIITNEIDSQQIEVSVPPYRTDVTRPADIVEEVLRIYGFNQVELEEEFGTPYVSFARNTPEEDLKQPIRKLLAGSGFNEMLCNTLTHPTTAEKIAGFQKENNVVLVNAGSEDLSVMRQALFFTGLNSIAYNINHKISDLKYFEIGKVYTNNQGDYEEKWRLAIYLTGNKLPESWSEQNRKTHFHDLKLFVEQIFGALNIQKVKWKASIPPHFAYGLSLETKGKTLGSLGLLHPKTTQYFDIKQEVFYADLDWEELTKNYSKKVSFQPIPKYPSVRRDLSMIIEKSLSYEEIEKIAKQAGQPLLKELNLFDVYEGEHLPSGKKSYSISFTFLDENKTLEDSITEKVMDKIMKAIEGVGATIRK